MLRWPLDARHLIAPGAWLPLVLLAACAAPESPPPFLRNHQLEARGNEPFWTMRIDGRSAVVRTPDLLDGIDYKDGRWTVQDEGGRRWTWKGRRRTAEGLWLSFEVREQACTDAMSGKAYPLTARISFEGRQMDGCAS